MHAESKERNAPEAKLFALKVGSILIASWVLVFALQC